MSRLEDGGALRRWIPLIVKRRLFKKDAFLFFPHYEESQRMQNKQELKHQFKNVIGIDWHWVEMGGGHR